MIELTCVSCATTEAVYDSLVAKRDKKCPICGEPMIEFRQPGSAPHVEEHPSL